MHLHKPLPARNVKLPLLWAACTLALLWSMTSVAHAQLPNPPEGDGVDNPPCVDAFIGCGDGSQVAQAAEGSSSSVADTGSPSVTQLTFEPHCINLDRRNCSAFQVVNGGELQTATLRAGDIVDIDVVLHTPEPSKVSTVRAWLKFDPAFLEARSVELSPALSQPIPGEQAIDAVEGVVKIGGGTNGALTTPKTSIARVTFRVKSTSSNTTVSFHNFNDEGSGETSVKSTDDASMISTQPTTLTVRLSTETVTASSSSAGGTFLDVLQGRNGQGSSSSAGGTVGGNTAFTLLQVQNVRVTSKDTNIFLGWQGLTSTDLAGYNVYYGTVSGKYIHRRSVPDSSSSLVIRDLEPATQYFLAVRAFNSKNQETVFSHEVSVIVGKPETSTAPLNAINPADLPPDGENPIEEYNGKNVTETGMSSTLALFALASAGIGTFFAWRRQMAIS